MNEQPATPRNPVKEVRQALGFSYHEMAVELGCAQSRVWEWEYNGTLPSKPYVLANLLRLAKQVGIDIEEAH
jgi:transcriptional regulator with XRE-family HTH domain